MCFYLRFAGSVCIAKAKNTAKTRITLIAFKKFSLLDRPRGKKKKESQTKLEQGNVVYNGNFFIISSTILKAAGQTAMFFKVRSVIC